jgi:hypothetical protein
MEIAEDASDRVEFDSPMTKEQFFEWLDGVK